MFNFKGLEKKFKQINREPSNACEGVWSQIRWTPDLVANEQIAIGVFLESNGIIHHKFLDDLGCLKCAYGKDIEQHFELAVDLIEFIFKSNSLNRISPQIVFDKRGFVRGNSCEDVLNNLFERAVPFGNLNQDQSVDARFPTLRTLTLINRVKAEIFNIIGDQVNSIFPSNPWIDVIHNNEAHKIDIPVHPFKSKQMASINSTIYRTFDKFENNCLTSMNNLHLAKNIGKTNDAVLFTLLPTDDDFKLLSESEQEKRLVFLKEFEWQLEFHEIEHKLLYTESDIAASLLNWVKPEYQDGIPRLL